MWYNISMKVIIGLGNISPDYNYSKTRHNIGFQLVDHLAEKYGVSFKENKKLRALIAEFVLNGEKIILVKPTTFYNLSGEAAKLILNYYKINPMKDMLVLQDDLSIDFGQIRVKDMGSAGGNNGIRSIISHYGTHFWRIKFGTKNELLERIPAADFVLSDFTGEEFILIKKIKPKITELIEDFINNKLENSSYKFQ